MALSDYGDVPTYDTPVGTFVSLYAGAGGMDIGFALAGFAPVWTSELSATALATHDAALTGLAKTRPHLNAVESTSHSGDLLAIPESLLPQRGSADLVIGGPPCQGFSVSGKMDPTDPRSEHVFHFMDMVERVNPKAFVMENVKALFQHKQWAHIREALHERAEQLGYNATMYLVNAADFGVPQARERMLFIGIRGDIDVPDAPAPTTAHAQPTLRDALGQLPAYGVEGNDGICGARVTVLKKPVLRQSPYAGMLFNGAGRPQNLDAPALTLTASMGGNKTPIIEQPLVENPDALSWVEQYHRQLLASGGTDIADVIPTSLRRMTVQEAAAVQTFPLGMAWSGSQAAQYRQIGNAVPPRLALAAAEAVKVSLGIS